MKLQNNLMLADARGKRHAALPVIGLVALKQSGGVLPAKETKLDFSAVNFCNGCLGVKYGKLSAIVSAGK